MPALRIIANFAGGLLGSRGAKVYGLGPLAPYCSSKAALPEAAYQYPCVSVPFSSLSYRDPCSLDVFAGCYHQDDRLAHVGCEMRAGSHVAFEGYVDSPLAGEWIVGPSPGTAQPNSFWVYRADGQLHRLNRSSNAVTSEFGYVRCLLSTVPPAGEACCNLTRSYEVCPASEESAAVPHPSGLAGKASLWVGLGTGLTCAALLSIVFLRRHLAAKRMQQPLLPAQHDAAARAEAVVGRLDECWEDGPLPPLEVVASRVDVPQAQDLGWCTRSEPADEPAGSPPPWDVMYVNSQGPLDTPARQSLPPWDVMYIED